MSPSAPVHQPMWRQGYAWCGRWGRSCARANPSSRFMPRVRRTWHLHVPMPRRILPSSASGFEGIVQMTAQASFPVRGRTTICASPLRQGSRARTMTRYVDRMPGQVVHCTDNLSAAESPSGSSIRVGACARYGTRLALLPQGSNGQTLSKERPGYDHDHDLPHPRISDGVSHH